MGSSPSVTPTVTRVTAANERGLFAAGRQDFLACRHHFVACHFHAAASQGAVHTDSALFLSPFVSPSAPKEGPR
jgi:hypothetical protein